MEVEQFILRFVIPPTNTRRISPWPRQQHTQIVC